MNNLSRLQHQFLNFILHDAKQIENEIIPTEKVSIQTRLHIYANAYRTRLIEALAANYPVLHNYLGKNDFESMGKEYIKNYPSTDHSIRWFGHDLEKFLQAHSHFSKSPYLAELAKLEWIITLCFDAADVNQQITDEAITHIPPQVWPAMRFSYHPSLHLATFNWNVVSIWQSFLDTETTIAPVALSFPQPYIFWRNNLVIQFCALPPDETAALKTLLAGKTFAEMCMDITEWHDIKDAARVNAFLLKDWIKAGMLTAIEYNNGGT